MGAKFISVRPLDLKRNVIYSLNFHSPHTLAYNIGAATRCAGVGTGRKCDFALHRSFQILRKGRRVGVRTQAGSAGPEGERGTPRAGAVGPSWQAPSGPRSLWIS